MPKDLKFEHVNLGPMQHCNRLALFSCVQEVARRRREGSRFDYLEIGVGHASTFAGMCKFFDFDLRLPHWRAVGVDIPNGWCFNRKACEDGLASWFVSCASVRDADKLEARKCTVLDCGSLTYLRNTKSMFDFVFVDGCHSAVCCAQDFVLVEPLVHVGGYVVFHDADRLQQGTQSHEALPYGKPEELLGRQRWTEDWDIQPHCHFGVGVRKALHCLDLLNGRRPGWKLIYDVTPDTSICRKKHNPESGSYCRGSCFFQRIA